MRIEYQLMAKAKVKNVILFSEDVTIMAENGSLMAVY